MKPVSTLTENTVIPISLVIVMAGAVFWLSSMYSKLEDAKASIIEIKNQQQVYCQDVKQISTDLAFIKGQISKIIKQNE